MERTVGANLRAQPASPLRGVGGVGLGWAGGAAPRPAYAVSPEPPQRLAAENISRLGGGARPRFRQRLAHEYAIPHVGASFEDLLGLDDLDALSVCLPNHLHSPVTLAALAAGKHVLCEKPLALNGDEANAMRRLALEQGRVLQVAFNYRHRGDVDVVRQQVQSGALGRIYHTRLWWLRRRGIPTIGSWFTGSKTSGGGALIDLGVHLLDLALYLTGDPNVLTVSAATHAELGSRDIGRFDVEDFACGLLRLDEGATLAFEIAWAAHGRADNEFGLTLYGTNGGAEITVSSDRGSDSLRIYADLGGVPSEIRPNLGIGLGHIGVVRDFVDAAIGQTARRPEHSGMMG